MIKAKAFELKDLENEWACHALQGIETMKIKTKNGSFEVSSYHVEDIIRQADKVRAIAAKTANAIIKFEALEEFDEEKNKNLMKLLTEYWTEYNILYEWCEDSSMVHCHRIKIIRDKNEMLCSFYGLRPVIRKRMEEYAEKYNRDLLYYF